MRQAQPSLPPLPCLLHLLHYFLHIVTNVKAVLFSELRLRAAKALWRCSPHSSAEGRAESLGGEMTPR